MINILILLMGFSWAGERQAYFFKASAAERKAERDRMDQEACRLEQEFSNSVMSHQRFQFLREKILALQVQDNVSVPSLRASVRRLRQDWTQDQLESYRILLKVFEREDPNESSLGPGYASPEVVERFLSQLSSDPRSASEGLSRHYGRHCRKPKVHGFPFGRESGLANYEPIFHCVTLLKKERDLIAEMRLGLSIVEELKKPSSALASFFDDDPTLFSGMLRSMVDLENYLRKFEGTQVPKQVQALIGIVKLWRKMVSVTREIDKIASFGPQGVPLELQNRSNQHYLADAILAVIRTLEDPRRTSQAAEALHRELNLSITHHEFELQRVSTKNPQSPQWGPSCVLR